MELDLSQCAKEPIHIPGSIQTYGQAVLFNPDSGRITGCSENLDTVGLGDGIESLIGRASLERIRQEVSWLRSEHHGLSKQLSLDSKDCHICLIGEEVLLEINQHALVNTQFDKAFGLNDMIRHLNSAEGILAKCEVATALMHQRLGIDRVMVYQFDGAFNGKVIAESCKPDTHSYLGLHFPESDIPAQARRLYLRKLLPLIADVHATPAGFVHETNRPVDLSDSYLRSVSPVHIQYLKNMGVSATLTCSIVVEGKLWGLVACHHYAPFYLSFDAMKQLEVFAQVLGAGIGFEERQQDSNFESKMKTFFLQMALHSDNLLKNANGKMDVVQDFLLYGELLKHTFEADSFYLLHASQVFSAERGDFEWLTPIFNKMQAKEAQGFFLSDGLYADLALEENTDLCGFAGGLLLKTGEAKDAFYWIWLKREYIHHITWGGDPNNKATVDSSGKLSPRTSFEGFVEKVTHKSLPWHQSIAQYVEKIIEAINNLLQQTTKIQTLFNLVDLHVITMQFDQYGILSSSSEAFCEISGFAKSELIKHPFKALLNPEMAWEIWQDLEANLEQQLPWEGELQHLRKEGSVFWVSAKFSPIFDPAGNFLGYTVIEYDITARKKLMQLQELQHFMEVWRKAFEQTGDGILELTLSNDQLHLSEYLTENLNYFSKTGKGIADWLDIVHPTELDAAHQRFDKLIRGTDQMFFSEVRLNTKGDEYRWFLERLLVLENKYELEPAILTGIYTDIDEIKKIHLLVEQQKDEFETIFSTAKDGIAILDLQANLLSLNPAFSEMLRMEQGEMVDYSLLAMCVPKELDRFKAILEKVSEQESITNYDIYFNRLDGSVVALNLALSIMPDQQRILLTAKDMTQQKRLENSLREAKTAAEQASEAKGQFLATMSHEIRTPMNGIINLSNLLLKQPLDDKAKHFADLIYQSSHSLLGILNDILDFSKIEANRLEIKNEAVRFTEIIEEIEAIFSVVASKKAIQLVFDISDYFPPIVICDRLRVKQVLINLIGNAIKFTDQGMVHVLLDCTLGKERDLLEIMVRDTGIGISAEVQQRLFQPFSQADASTTRRFGGTGLGLAISKSLVHLMGGEMKLFSREGLGTTFTVSIPVDKADPDTAPKYQASLPNGLNDLSAFRVLLVEDVPVNQLITSEYIQSEGVTVDVAENGQVALQMVAKNSYDLILMDVQMPVMDGVEATIELRRLGYELPIIAITAAVLGEETDKVLKAGVNDVILKPVSELLLKQKLRQYLLNPSQAMTGLATGAALTVSQVEEEGYFSCEGLLKKMHGKKALIKQMLSLFVEQYQSFIEDYETLKTEKNYAQLLNKVHTLKGSVGFLGAKNLYDLVAELHINIKNHPEQIDDERFKRCFKETLEQIYEFQKACFA